MDPKLVLPERIILEIEKEQLRIETEMQTRLKEARLQMPLKRVICVERAALEKVLENLRQRLWTNVKRAYYVPKIEGRPDFCDFIAGNYDSPESGTRWELAIKLAEASDNNDALTINELAEMLDEDLMNIVSNIFKLKDGLKKLNIEIEEYEAKRETSRGLLRKAPAYRLIWANANEQAESRIAPQWKSPARHTKRKPVAAPTKEVQPPSISSPIAPPPAPPMASSTPVNHSLAGRPASTSAATVGSAKVDRFGRRLDDPDDVATKKF